ncbi:GNAT family N-acetyltransferase [Oceanivirga salmonicida]|uniref:GNAT family N-acetyltransferase n=1 Tax=Oceanivirga salmonicida TaxID=1769291 RepID=UPI000832D15A|nr:GNAT family N-acetyltransferase [Oceanivirga salmonicida]
MKIETDRLILRKFKVSDAKDMFENYANDEEVTKYITWKPHNNINETKTLLETWVKNYENGDYFLWAICLKVDNKVIGSIQAGKLNDIFKSTEIGYCLSKKYWNKGIMSEALNAVINYMFTNTDCTLIRARHDTRNINSGLVMKKCKIKYEGTLRQNGINNSGICDDAYYSILKEEFIY